jgi:hypothetical protein
VPFDASVDLTDAPKAPAGERPLRLEICSTRLTPACPGNEALQIVDEGLNDSFLILGLVVAFEREAMHSPRAKPPRNWRCTGRPSRKSKLGTAT